MEFEMFTQLISQVGFPIFTAVYMMTTVTKVLNQNTEALQELRASIEKREQV